MKLLKIMQNYRNDKSKESLAIVCNSINPDLVQYFLCKINSVDTNQLRERVVVLRNSNINLTNKHIRSYVSSHSQSSFFHWKVLLDAIISIWLCYVLLRNNVKTVHFTTAHLSNVFLSLLLKPFKVKQIYTIHDVIPHPGKKARFIRLYNDFVTKTLADELIIFSSKSRPTDTTAKITVMSLAGFPQHTNQPKMGARSILFFGRMENYKGFANLLDLIKKHNEAKLDYQFILAGKGNIEHLDEFARLENVKIINRFISEKEVGELFASATFTVLPYDSATQSGVTILSYSYATPVIAYDVGSLAEYVEDGINGVVVDYKDNNKIIEILRTTSNVDVLSLSRSVINIFSEKYSSAACKRQYMDYYTNIINDYR